MDIIQRINMESKNHPLYKVNMSQYKDNVHYGIPFRVSPEPFKMSKKQKQELMEIGNAICSYMDACIELYSLDEHVKDLLDRGKSEEYKKGIIPQYLFLRPDLLLSENGFSICEIETSPFGLGLAEVLNRSYGNEGHDTIVYENTLRSYIHKNIADTGTIVHTDKVDSFSGQLDYLASEVFSGEGKYWDSKKIGLQTDINSHEIYRAFYLNESYSNPNVAEFLKRDYIHTPSKTPQFEEKALLAFIWDTRYSEFFKQRLGITAYNLLRKAIPKTWIIGEEEFVEGGLPKGKTSSIDIADLSKKNREFVLKVSGFSDISSWGKGVKFLHKMGGNKAREMIQLASSDKEHLYIMQEFSPLIITPMKFIDEKGIVQIVDSRIRITPYFAYTGEEKGKIIAIKVTGCENTEYIHAGTSSINTSVSLERDGR